MIIHKSYQFRLKPSEDQVAIMKQHGGNTRFVWNKLLEYSKEYKEKTDKYPTQSQLQKYIVPLKKENEFLRISHSQPLQVKAMDLMDAYAKAFDPKTVKLRNQEISKAIASTEKDKEKKEKNIKKAMDYGFPKFKSKNKYCDSIFYPQNFIIKKSRIYFAKLGWFNYIKHREIEGKIKFVTIKQENCNGNKYYVSITTELEIEDKEKPALDKENIVGIDVGLTTFATLSDGTTIENPRTLNKSLRKLRRESKRLSNKEYKETDKKTNYGKVIMQSSHNRDKQISKVQKVHRKIRNIRKDFLHKTTHHIITKYDGVILEDLDISGLLKINGKAMNRSISDVSWSMFGIMLEYKSVWNFKHFCKVDRYFPSTQKCSVCGNISHLSLEDRVYFCPNCKAEIGRDPNSSTCIKDEGMKILESMVEEEIEKKKKLEELNKQNTVATTGIQVCGSTSLEVGMKQKKRRFQKPTKISA